jgi:hypothetical protein
MSWQPDVAANALVGLLAPLDPTVSVFGTPPETFNAPALIVWYPRLVRHNGFAFGVDLVELPVTCAGGVFDFPKVHALTVAVAAAVSADPTCGGQVPAVVPLEQSNWRQMTVGGATMLAADEVLQLRM